MTQDPALNRVTPHDLRHTAASLAISAGAHVTALQGMLGHASAAMTLDRYSDLFDDDLDLVAAALSRARSESAQMRIAVRANANPGAEQGLPWRADPPSISGRGI